MNDQEYLEAVLKDQTLTEGSDELTALRERRQEVKDLLVSAFGSEPSIWYAGSYKKGTMIKESYDLDITCYFPRDSDVAGSTLQEIYERVEEVLREKFWTERKGSAIRLRSRDDRRRDFHVDVVPGRFVNGKDGDIHLYRTSGDKQYLKTNLGVHTDYVRKSGVVPAIRIVKLWSVRRGVNLKTFALELLVIDLLKGYKKKELAAQLEHLLREFHEHASSLSVTDPANANNDLSGLLNEVVRLNLEHAAGATLETLEADGWQALFGPVEKKQKAAALAGMARSNPIRTKPYHGGADVV